MHSQVGKTPCSYGQNRKEQVVLTRCRIGHSRLTHSQLLNNEERPECIPCNSNYSLKHVLIDCVDVADIRQTFYNANSLFNLFTNIAGDTILQFLIEIDLYTKIQLYNICSRCMVFIFLMFLLFVEPQRVCRGQNRHQATVSLK